MIDQNSLSHTRNVEERQWYKVYLYDKYSDFTLLSQDFGANSIHVLETLKSMVPPHISSTDGKSNLVTKAMRPGRKIMPKGPMEHPRHATNSRLLKWSMGSGGPSPGSSLSGPSPQSSGKCIIKLSMIIVVVSV